MESPERPPQQREPLQQALRQEPLQREPQRREPLHRDSRSRNLLLGLLLLTALTYARLWGVEFSWDDEALIVDNQVTGALDLESVKAFFTRDLWSTTRLPTLKSGYYRPLMLLSLALDRAAFGLSSAAAHAHSLLWHLGAVAALFALIRRLLGAGPALAGSLLFALHPVQAEVLALVAKGLSSRAIGEQLGLSHRTVETHRRHIGTKLGAGSVAELVRAAVRLGLVE